MNTTNKHNLHPLIERAVKNDPYDNKGADISTTSLIDPPQLVALRKRHAGAIVEDVSERLWSMLGQAMHVILERAAEGRDIISEQRYEAKVLGWKVSGQVDLIDGDTLLDLKVTSVFTYIYGSRLREWAEQNNVNHWLYYQATGKYVTKLQNILFLRDWVSSKSFKPGDKYPPVQVVTVDLPLWPLDKAENYVRERVALHQAAQALPDDKLPFCTDEERWHSNKTGKYARCHVETGYCPVRKGICFQNKSEEGINVSIRRD